MSVFVFVFVFVLVFVFVFVHQGKSGESRMVRFS